MTEARSGAPLALVTGGGRGIGRAISLGLARDGHDVAIGYHRDVAAAEHAAGEVRGLGRRAGAFAAALDAPETLEGMVAAVERELGPVDVLVSNAGIASLGHSVAETDPAELERVVRVHALGPHRLCQLVVPGMCERGRGHVVVISSQATRLFGPRSAPYNMGKAALEALAFTLAREVRRHGVRVNVVAPGLVETEMGRRLMRATAGVQDMRELDDRMPFGRVCQPGDVAAAVRFLVSEGASYITGERLAVSGGT